MNCCGKKKDVRHSTAKGHHHGSVRASKFYSVDSNPELVTNGKGFVPIRQTNVNSYSKVTKPQNYAQEHYGGSESRLLGKVAELNFKLDEDPGVSNTFDLPTFDYQTMLVHNIYYNLNRKGQINLDDGNTSRFISNGTQKTGK